MRQRIETSSRPVLVRLHRLPRLVVPLVTVLLFVIGALAPVAVGLTALAVALVFMTWIAYLSWPAVDTTGRLLRLAMLTLIIFLAASRF